jgi:hypothetical protein
MATIRHRGTAFHVQIRKVGYPPVRRVSAVSRLQKDGQKQPKQIWKDNFRYLSLAHLLLVTF